MERLLSLARIARLLDLSIAAVQRMFDTGTLPPPVRLPNGDLRWRAGDVDAWMCELPMVATPAEEPVTPRLRHVTPPVTPRDATVTPSDANSRQPDGVTVASPDLDDDTETKTQAVSRGILAVLRRENTWISGAELAAAVDPDLDQRSGTFVRAARLLRETGQIETNQTHGYRIKRIDSS